MPVASPRTRAVPYRNTKITHSQGNPLQFFDPPPFSARAAGNAIFASYLKKFCALEPAKDPPAARRTRRRLGEGHREGVLARARLFLRAGGRLAWAGGCGLRPAGRLACLVHGCRWAACCWSGRAYGLRCAAACFVCGCVCVCEPMACRLPVAMVCRWSGLRPAAAVQPCR